MKWTRRRLVGTAVAAAALAGCLDDSGAGDDGASGDGSEAEAEETAESDGGRIDRNAEDVLAEHDLEDHTGKETVDITVDPDAGFEPQALEIDADTVLNWIWEGSSTEIYPIDIPDECFWDEEVDEETVDEQTTGDEYDRLFWAAGAYLYESRDDDGTEFTGVFRVHEVDDEDE